MTIEEKVREILNPLLNLPADYAIEFGDTCVMCGFPLNKKNREKMILEATQAILALIKPMSRERLIKIMINYSMPDNIVVGEPEFGEVADAILAEWQKGLK